MQPLDRDFGSTAASLTSDPDPTRRRLYRSGGLAAIAVVLGYFGVTVLYVGVYPFPDRGTEMLEYLQGKETVWWTIVAVSALTDVLYPYLAYSLYQALRGVNREVMVVAAGCMSLFAVLELAITWPAYAQLISLSDSYGASATEMQRLAYGAAADSATAIVNSTLLAFYAIGLPAVGSILIGLTMRKAVFGKITAYLGITAGAVSVVAVVGPLFTSTLDATIIVGASLTTVWLLLTGVRLYRLGSPDTVDARIT